MVQCITFAQDRPLKVFGSKPFLVKLVKENRVENMESLSVIVHLAHCDRYSYDILDWYVHLTYSIKGAFLAGYDAMTRTKVDKDTLEPSSPSKPLVNTDRLIIDDDHHLDGGFEIDFHLPNLVYGGRRAYPIISPLNRLTITHDDGETTVHDIVAH